MTDLLTRPLLKVKPTAEPARRPLAVSAALAAAATGAGGLVICTAVCVAAWFGGSTGSFAGAVRVGVLAWLVAHGSGVAVGDLSLTAVPVGGLGLLALALYRAGRWAGSHAAVRRDADLVSGVAAFAGTYAVLASVAATVAGTPSASTGPVRTLAATLLSSALAGGTGLVRGSGRSAQLLARLPAPARATTAGATAGWLAMVGASGLLVTASLVVQFSDVLRLTESIAAGGLGGALLAVLGGLALPNAVLCAGAYLAGPGFSLGVGTTVAPGEVRLGRLPAFPLLAIVPEDGAHGLWQSSLVLVPVLAGALAGATAWRRMDAAVPAVPAEAGAGSRASARLLSAASVGGSAGLAGGVTFGLSTWLATGSVGPGRMQQFGPAVLATTGICAVALALGGAATAAVLAWWSASGRRATKDTTAVASPAADRPDDDGAVSPAGVAEGAVSSATSSGADSGGTAG